MVDNREKLAGKNRQRDQELLANPFQEEASESCFRCLREGESPPLKEAAISSPTTASAAAAAAAATATTTCSTTIPTAVTAEPNGLEKDHGFPGRKRTQVLNATRASSQGGNGRCGISSNS